VRNKIVFFKFGSMGAGNTRRRINIETEGRNKEIARPSQSVLFYALTGSSIVFLTLTLFYSIWLNRNPQGFHFDLPKIFTISTIVLLISSHTLSRASIAFEKDHSNGLLTALSITFALSIIFAVLQINGMIDLFSDGILLNSTGAVFLFGLMAFQLMHIIGGTIYLFYLCLKAFDNWQDPVKSLIYFSNKYELNSIQLLSIFWYFANVIWVILFIIFLFTVR
jgi:cytochrome c oxidase subunit 3